MQNSVQTEIISQTQLCERLRHLTQFSSHILYVSGEAGSGKSTICRALVDSDFNQKTILLSLSEMVNDRAIRQQILQQITYDGAFNAQLSLVNSLMQLSEQIQHELTICIDNAHYLSEQICNEFVQLVELRLRNKIDFKFNVILFAETEWVENKMAKSDDPSRHIVELEVEQLEPKAALQFVNALFEQAGYEPAFANQDAILRQIESCQGNPDALTRCANAIMKGEVFIPGSTRQKPASAAAEQSSPSRSFYYAGIIGVIMVAGIAGSWWYDSYRAEPSSTEQSVDIPADSSIPLPPTETLSDATPKAVSEPEVLAANWDDELPESIGDSITLTEKPRQQDNKKRVVVDDKQVNEMIAQQAKSEQKVPQQKTPQSIVQPKESQQKANPQSDEPMAFTLTPAAELMGKPAQHYTFQIAGLSKLALLQRYLSEHQFDQQIWYYKTMRKDKEWYVVLYGDFETIAEANAAKAKLPASVKKASPWMKTFSQVQRDLQKNNAN